MKELHYILRQSKKFFYTQWDDAELIKCIDMLTNLTRQELVTLYTNRWVSHSKTLKKEIFKSLFSEQISKFKDKIKEMDTDKLIEELLNKKSGMVSTARRELRTRFLENVGEDRVKIALAFAESSIKDNKWVESQLKKELYGLG